MQIKLMGLMILEFFIKNRKKIPVYADKITRKYLYKSFSYCFENYKNYPAILEFVNFKKRFHLISH